MLNSPYLTVACCAGALTIAASAGAADINGAWVTNPSLCDKVFEKKGGTMSISGTSEMYASGFIIDKDRIRGKMVDCAIETRKQDGDLVYLIAACSTDVALSHVQFSLRIDGEDKITRVFPGMPEMAISYERCK
jgi:hypothetical protein